MRRRIGKLEIFRQALMAVSFEEVVSKLVIILAIHDIIFERKAWHNSIIHVDRDAEVIKVYMNKYIIDIRRRERVIKVDVKTRCHGESG